jgi:hypothetical protein
MPDIFDQIDTKAPKTAPAAPAKDLFDEVAPSIQRTDANGKPVIGVAKSPEGDVWAQVIDLPAKEVTATRLPETPEARRVREYVDTQRYYANQKNIPQIGGVNSPEYQAGQKMSAIEAGLRSNVFINPLAPTMESIRAGVAGAKMLGEGVKTVGENVDLSGAVPIVINPKEAATGAVKAVAGAAESVMSAAMAASPAANLTFGAAAEVAPGAMPFVSPISYLTKPDSEIGKLAAMVGDVVYQGAVLHTAGKIAPEAAAALQEKINDKIPLTQEEKQFILLNAERQKAGDVRVANTQYRNEGTRMGNELQSEVDANAQAKAQAKADMENELGKQLSDAEFQMRLDEQTAQKREYQAPADITPQGKSELLPSTLVDEFGKPIPNQEVQQARAPLTQAEIASTPFEGNKNILSPEALAEQTKNLPAIEIPQSEAAVKERISPEQVESKINDASLFQRKSWLAQDDNQLLRALGYSDTQIETFKPEDVQHIRERVVAPDVPGSVPIRDITPEQALPTPPKPIRVRVKPVEGDMPDASGFTAGKALPILSVGGNYIGNQLIRNSSLDDDTKKKLSTALDAITVLGLGAAALGMVKLNPGMRAKLINTLKMDAKSTDAELLKGLEEKSGNTNLEVGKKGEVRAENINLGKEGRSASGTAEVVAQITPAEIKDVRSKISNADTKQLAKAEGKFVQDALDGKIVDRQALRREQVVALQDHLEAVVQKNEGKGFAEWSVDDQKAVNVARVMISGAFEAGGTLQIYNLGVSPVMAKFLRTIDPKYNPVEKLPPSALEMLAVVGAAMKLWSGSSVLRSLVGNATATGLRLPEFVLTVGVDKLLSSGLGKSRTRYSEEIFTNHITGNGLYRESFKTSLDLLGGDPENMAKNIFLATEGFRPSTLPGKTGHFVETSLRTQGSVDAFFRQPLERKELASMAIREAFKTASKDESWESINKRAKTLYDNAPLEWKQIADDRAKYFTFQQKGGASLQHFNKFRGVPAARIVIPFFNTGANLFKYAYERIPVVGQLTPSFLQAIWEATTTHDVGDLTRIQKGLAKMTGREFEPGQTGHLAEKIARGVMGAALFSTTALVVDKLLDGHIAGDYPTDKNEAEAWKAAGKQANSIEIGGYWINYQGYEPISSFFATLANYRDSRDRGASMVGAVAQAYKGFISSMLENPTFVGIKYMGDALMQAFDTGDIKQPAVKAISSFLTGMVEPTFLRQTAGVVDPRVLDPEGFAQNIASTIPGATKNIPAKMDVLGREREHELPAARLLGINLSQEQTDIVRKEFMRLKYAPIPPSTAYSGLKLTSDEQRKLQEIAGKQMEKILYPIMNSGGWGRMPDDFKTALIDDFRDKIYDVQRKILFPKKPVLGKLMGAQISSDKVSEVLNNMNGLSADERKQVLDAIGQ